MNIETMGLGELRSLEERIRARCRQISDMESQTPKCDAAIAASGYDFEQSLRRMQEYEAAYQEESPARCPECRQRLAWYGKRLAWYGKWMAVKSFYCDECGCCLPNCPKCIAEGRLHVCTAPKSKEQESCPT